MELFKYSITRNYIGIFTLQQHNNRKTQPVLILFFYFFEGTIIVINASCGCTESFLVRIFTHNFFNVSVDIK